MGLLRALRFSSTLDLVQWDLECRLSLISIWYSEFGVWSLERCVDGLFG
jgi:hypothetical protein